MKARAVTDQGGDFKVDTCRFHFAETGILFGTSCLHVFLLEEVKQAF